MKHRLVRALLVVGCLAAAATIGLAQVQTGHVLVRSYSVKLEMAGFQATERQNVVVQVGQTTPVDVAPTVTSLSETVTVSGESAVIDTTSANVNVTFG